MWHEHAPEGKLDLLVTLDFRMSTTCVYSDIVLPTATWYEKNDLNTSDMHPFIHPLSSAADPAWEARSDWEIFKGIAKKFSDVAPEVLGVEKDVVLVPTLHDTAGELAQPKDVLDWKRGEVEPIPGKTMPSVVVVERDYPNLYKRYTSVGPLLDKLGNGGKGISWNTQHESICWPSSTARLASRVRAKAVRASTPISTPRKSSCRWHRKPTVKWP